MIRRSTLLLLAALQAGCTYSIHQVHVGDFDPGVAKSKGKVVTAESERFIILGFASETDYVDKAYRDLMDKCSGGEIQGITTQFSTAHGFFSWTNKIRMQGLCLE